jgi:hypothetical protein
MAGIVGIGTSAASKNSPKVPYPCEGRAGSADIDTMKTPNSLAAVLCAAALIGAHVGRGEAQSAEGKPNIVIIMSDDQGWTDYGFMGHGEIRTPHLDKLAGRSVVFERGYVASPLCRPSLASVITGRMPSEHGVTGT